LTIVLSVLPVYVLWLHLWSNLSYKHWWTTISMNCYIFIITKDIIMFVW
jgi:hypothetical protein